MSTDPFDQLDEALGNVRALSRLIRQATEAAQRREPLAGDTWANVLDVLIRQRRHAVGRVALLIAATDGQDDDRA